MNANEGSTVYTLIGSLIILVLLPILCFEGDQSSGRTDAQRAISPTAILLSMASAVLTSASLPAILYGDKGGSRVRVRDIVNSLVGGGIACGAGSPSGSPYLAMLVGLIASVLQYVFDNYVESKVFRRWGIVSTNSTTLFCLQTLLSAIFSFLLTNQTGQIYAFLVSGGIGVAYGVVIALIWNIGEIYN